MPIVLTFVTGDTVTLAEDGSWTGENALLVALVEQTALPSRDTFVADPLLALARQVVREVPGFTLAEIDRPRLKLMSKEIVP